jgi:gamma-glutamyltranspeptidase/glutathione hydrolase
VLVQGGNAADAAVAMVFAGSVAEGTLTSLAGGGFFLVGGAPDGSAPVYVDAFVRNPGLGEPRPHSPWERFDLELSGAVLSFGTGPAAVAVPALPRGLAYVARRWGRLGTEACARPAAELAQEGVRVTAVQAGEQRLNADMLRRTPDGAGIFVDPATGTTRLEGELFRQPQLAATIEELGATQCRSFYEGGLGERLMAWSDERGARISREDLRALRVFASQPLEVRVDGGTLYANPAPAYGGRILAAMIERLFGEGSPGDLAHVLDVVRRVVAGVKAPRTRPPVHGESVVSALLPQDADPLTVETGAYSCSPHTTHVCAVDADGMYVSATSTVGYGSAEFVPGTGLHLNNMLAEYDHTLARPAGARIPSMMTPSAWVDRTRCVVIGSAGSDRIPQAITQVVARLTSSCPDLADAVAAPRFVAGGEVLHLEPGMDPAELDPARPAEQINVWDERDGYFGTTNAVLVDAAGMQAAGDPRRDCVAIVL